MAKEGLPLVHFWSRRGANGRFLWQWLRYCAAVLTEFPAVFLRFLLLSDLGRGTRCLLNDPAVMTAAVCGGYQAGIAVGVTTARMAFGRIQPGSMSAVERLALDGMKAVRQFRCQYTRMFTALHRMENHLVVEVQP